MPAEGSCPAVHVPPPEWGDTSTWLTERIHVLGDTRKQSGTAPRKPIISRPQNIDLLEDLCISYCMWGAGRARPTLGAIMTQELTLEHNFRCDLGLCYGGSMIDCFP